MANSAILFQMANCAILKFYKISMTRIDYNQNFRKYLKNVMLRIGFIEKMKSHNKTAD
jgi:hypothetical protein